MPKLILELKTNSDVMTEKIKAYFDIVRPLNAAVMLFTLLTAFVYFGKAVGVTTAVLILLPWILGLMAGNVINDIYDLGIDKINKSHRPLPSGRISLSAAKRLYGMLVLISFLFAALHSPLNLLVVINFHGLMLLYSVYLKRKKLIGNAVVAYATGFSFIYVALSIQIGLSEAIIPAGFAFMMTMARELVKDIEDVAADSALGIRTLAVVKNGAVSVQLTIFFLALVVAEIFVIYAYALLNIEFFIVCCVIVIPLIVLSIKHLVKDMRTNISRVSALLKYAMIAGTGALLLAH